MKQAFARVNQPYGTLTLASALRKMFGVQLYKNNAHALLSRILSILNLDWLQHAHSVRMSCNMRLSKWMRQAEYMYKYHIFRTKLMICYDMFFMFYNEAHTL